jgi:hypothetical protein
LEERGLPIPNDLKPEKETEFLDEFEIEIWCAFQSLNLQRKITEHGPRAISIMEIKCYLELIPLSDSNEEKVSDFLAHFQQLDSHYMSKEFERIREEERKRARKNKSRGRGSSD